MFFPWHRLKNIPDTSAEIYKNYTYTFSSCSPFDCQGRGEHDALVREYSSSKQSLCIYDIIQVCIYACVHYVHIYSGTSLMRIPLGPTQRVRNSEASIFWRLPVIFPIGVAISIRHTRDHFMALATRWLSLACCKGC